MDPLFGMSREEQVYFVTRWLDNEGRDRLRLADQYYKNVILGQGSALAGNQVAVVGNNSCIAKPLAARVRGIFDGGSSPINKNRYIADAK